MLPGSQEVLKLAQLVLIQAFPLQQLTSEMVRHCLNGCVCPLARLHDANLDHPRADLVETDITAFSYLLGPFRCNSGQALMAKEADWVWLGVTHPHRNTTTVYSSKASYHLGILGVAPM